MGSHRVGRTILRRARPADAEGIGALYVEAYGAGSSPDAAQRYPFPQFLDPDWLIHGTGQEGVLWLVAEQYGRIVGSAGAAWAHGAAEDRVAEVFGIVVGQAARCQGIATKLLETLRERLAPEARFILCESRTADPGALKVARRCRFVPIGLEPFAHTTPSGSEPMLLTAAILDESWSLRAPPNSLSRRARGIAGAVLGPGTCQAVEVRDASTANAAIVGRGGALALSRDDEMGRAILQERPEAPHRDGIVGLSRLEGDDMGRGRYDRRYYVARSGESAFGALRVSWDRIDRRARLLELRTDRPGTQAAMIAIVAAELEAQCGEDPLTLVVDVRSDFVDLQLALEGFRFFPSVYYPSFIGTESGRIDVIQYTRLFRQNLGHDASNVVESDWPEAVRTVKAVCLAAGD